MTVRMCGFRAAILVAIVAVTVQIALCQTPFDAPPTITVSSSKSTYDLFEPVVIDITVTNATNTIQFYGPAGSLYGAHSYELLTPDGSKAQTHGAHVLNNAREPLLRSPYRPGESRQYEFLPSLLWPIWPETGTYTLKVQFPSDIFGTSYTTLASATFDVTYPVGVDSAIVDTLTLAAEKILNLGSGVPSEIHGAIDTVLTLGSLPSYYREFAAYMDALWSDYRDASGDWEGFLTTYPNSEYVRAATYGQDGFYQYQGAVPYGDQLVAPALLRTRLLLEGAYESPDSMSVTEEFAGSRDRGQPYDSDPWLYVAVDSLWDDRDSDFYDGIIDWVLVSLIDTAAVPDTVVSQSVSLLNSRSVAYASFYYLPPGQYRVIIQHRNHLAIASDTLVDFTSGYAQHDFTTGRALSDGPGVAAQQQIVSGTDTVYAMFAGDATSDCHITASDFNAYLIATKAVEKGYLETDFDMDYQVTANDFNMWLFNTKAVAKSAGKACLTGNGFSRAPYTGQGSESTSKTSTAQGIDARYYITGNANQFSGSLNATINVRTWEWTDTLGSFVFDVYFNSDQLDYAWPLNHQALLDAGYSLEIAESANEHGSFVRVQAYTNRPDTVTYQIHGYDFLPIQVRLRFYESDGTVTSHDVAFNRATLSVAVTEDGKVVEKEEITPVYVDLYTY